MYDILTKVWVVVWRVLKNYIVQVWCSI